MRELFSMKKCDYPFSLIKEIKLKVFKTAFDYRCRWGGWAVGVLSESQRSMLSDLCKLLLYLASYQRLSKDLGGCAQILPFL